MLTNRKKKDNNFLKDSPSSPNLMGHNFQVNPFPRIWTFSFLFILDRILNLASMESKLCLLIS
ncbi:hypothetical protein LEP1GSC017_3573 [Leptospira meyeri serovar Hardjo str. Went 5]|nr:hypothetical protein LEP1GSC017_3573 [Leptospira meyeri serovar Hardjo str. Went 5]